MMPVDYRDLHADSIVIDAVCPLVMDDYRYLEWYRDGGETALSPTVGGWEGARPALDRLASWHSEVRAREDLVIIRNSGELEDLKGTGKLGVFFHLQGADPIEDNLDLVSLYKSLGVGVVQLTYNVKNRVGDGCEERSDGGLSTFGIKLIAKLNDARIVVDCSHTGKRTSLEAIEASASPVVLSHSNVNYVHPSPRNVDNELIDAISANGGVIGIAGFPAMISSSIKPSLDQFLAHVDAIVDRSGIDHVGLGIDYYWGQSGVASDADAIRSYETAVQAGRWSAAYPPPPHHYPDGIETPRNLPRLTDALLQRGYSPADVRKILGGNWLRVFKTVWG